MPAAARCRREGSCQSCRGWTPAQARAVLPMLAPDRPTQEQVAEDSGITRQAVRQALVAAGFPALSTALDLLEAS